MGNLLELCTIEILLLVVLLLINAAAVNAHNLTFLQKLLFPMIKFPPMMFFIVVGMPWFVQ